MAINLLRQYKTNIEYNNEKCELEEPIVSLIDETLDVKYGGEK